MKYAPVREGPANYPMQAIFHDTAPANSSPWVRPGKYTAKLTAGSKTYSERFDVKMDPRVHTSEADLVQQFSVSKQLYDDVLEASKSLEQIRAIRKQVEQLRASAAKDAIDAFDKKLSDIEGAGGGRGVRFGATGGPDTLSSVRGSLSMLMATVQGADVAPTTQLVRAAADRRQALAGLLEKWRALKEADLISLNAQLKQANLPEITMQ